MNSPSHSSSLFLLSPATVFGSVGSASGLSSAVMSTADEDFWEATTATAEPSNVTEATDDGSRTPRSALFLTSLTKSAVCAQAL